MIIMINLLLLILFLLCDSKSNLKNQITIAINSIDKASKQRRINMFDTVEISEESGGFFKKSFKIVGEFKTDSAGSVKVKVDPNKICNMYVKGFNVSGGTMYMSGKLKNGQELNIEVNFFKNN